MLLKPETLKMTIDWMELAKEIIDDCAGAELTMSQEEVNQLINGLITQITDGYHVVQTIKKDLGVE